MARIVSICGDCGTKTIRHYFEASMVPAKWFKGERIYAVKWCHPSTGERVCLAYEQDGCGGCSWHPQGQPHVRCQNCGGQMRHHFKRADVKVTHSDRIKCGAKCHAATSDTCTCECDGMNHGKALRMQLVAV